MARIVNPPKTNTGGRPSIYPWKEWSDGLWREALRGTDYRCTDTSFQSAVHRHAMRHGRTAETRVTDDGVTFVVHLAKEAPCSATSPDH